MEVEHRRKDGVLALLQQKKQTKKEKVKNELSCPYITSEQESFLVNFLVNTSVYLLTNTFCHKGRTKLDLKKKVKMEKKSCFQQLFLNKSYKVNDTLLY